MKYFMIRLVFIAIFSFLFVSCTAPQTQDAPSQADTQPQVISSYPSGLEPISGKGITMSGHDLDGVTELVVDKDGKYRFEWSIQSPIGGKVSLVNNDTRAEEMFARVVLLNLNKPSEGAMDIALVEGVYHLEINGLQGAWKFTFHLVEERDFKE